MKIYQRSEGGYLANSHLSWQKASRYSLARQTVYIGAKEKNEVGVYGLIVI